jgi:glycosyltransferase involved in cell wall biosynthesis
VLAECIESVLSQTYARWEYVIVDNCSTDATPGIISRYASADDRFRVYRNQETVSALRNHNIGVRKVSGSSEYCKILHADDRMLPTCLEKMVAVAEEHASVGIVSSLARWGSQIVCRGLPPEQSFFTGKDIARRTLRGETYPFWSPSCLLHRTRAISERPRFYDETALHADVQSSYEILAKWDFAFVHEPLTVIGSHDASITSTLAKPMKKLLASNLDLLATYGPKFLSHDELEARMEQQIAQYYQSLAKSAFEWRGADFWGFHREALSKAGRPMSTRRMLRAILTELRASPLNSVRQLYRSALNRQHA